MRFWQRHRHTLLLLAIIAVASLLRLYRLDGAPPGINGDELFNAIDAKRIGGGNWPLYFPGNNGREPLFLYLMAATIRLVGDTIVGFRLPAVLLGTANVVLAYLIGRRGWKRPEVGLLAAGLTAVSLWPLMGSRWGLRAVSLTTLTALTVYGLLRATQDNRTRDWLLSGVALGLVPYTYIPGRGFFLVPLAWLLWLLLWQRDRLRDQWRGWLLSALVALFVFAPLGQYMIENTDLVNQRIYSMGSAWKKTRQGNPASLIEPTVSALGMFSFKGDREWRYHVSEKPVFDPVTSLFFYAGVLACGWAALRRRQTKKDEETSAAALMLLWLGAMIAPNALLNANPSFLRAAGAMTPAYVITAVGVVAVYDQIKQRWPRTTKRPWLPALAAIGLALILADTWQAYFVTWAQNPAVREIYQADLARMGSFLETADIPAETRVFVGHPYAYDAAPRTLAYYTEQPVSWFTPGRIFPWGDGPARYLLPLDETLGGAPAAVKEGEKTAVSYQNGDPAFTLYQVAPSGIRAEHTIHHPIPNHPTLTGLDWPQQIHRGESIPLTLHWQIPAEAIGQPNQPRYTHAQLIDAGGSVWNQNRALLGYPQSSWRAGDHFTQRLSLEAPAGMPPGAITLRLTLTDAAGDQVVQMEPVTAGPFLVQGRPLADFTLTPEMVVFADTIALIEAALSHLTEPGLPIDLSVDWVTLQKPEADYRLRLQLVDPATGAPLVSQTFAILPNAYPPSRWGEREQVRSLHRLNVPADVVSQTTTLALQAHLLPPEGDEPLPISQGTATVAEIEVRVRERQFTIPLISNPMTAEFGPAIRLLGYDLPQTAYRPGDTIELTLYWQAAARPERNYTVFNHLIGEDGMLYGQFDSPPVGEAWLTNTWQPGEVVVEKRQIPIKPDAPPGEYALVAGLYTEENGRLPVTQNDQSQPEDQLRLTTVIVQPNTD